MAFDFDIFLPVVWLLVAAGIVMLIDLFSENAERVRMFNFFTAIGGLMLAFVSLNPYWDAPPQLIMRGALLVDQFSTYLTVAILLGTAISMFASLSYVKRIGVNLADFLITVLLAASGMVLLTVSNDLIMIFLSIELLSFSVYVLTGMHGRSSRSAEGAMKYFIMGAFATGIMVLGMACLYGITGELQLRPLGQALHGIFEARDGTEIMATFGMGTVLIAFAFKVGAVPFHSWVPDAYEGAPTTVTGFMAVAVKAAAFGALIRLAVVTFPPAAAAEGFFGDLGFAGWALWILSALSMILGNWFAISQRNIKRMLAYSSIAHSGYLLMGLAAAGGDSEAYAGVLYYLFAYTLMTSGAFAMLVYASSGGKDVESIDDIRGLAWKKPAVGIGMGIFMFSMAGIPLTAGFMGKYFVFAQTIAEGGRYLVLAIIGIATSIIGAYYYLRVVAYTYFREPDDRPVAGKEDWGLKFALSVTVFGTVFLGIFPQGFYDAAQDSVKELRYDATAVEDTEGVAMTEIADSFVGAFNRRDLNGLKELLADSATAEVLDSGFGTEQGPDDIVAKSLTHMLGDADSSLRAETFKHDGETLVLFMNDGVLDTAARIQGEDNKISRIEYYVVWHRLDDVEKIAAARGVKPAKPE